jgi:hypothetical protein
MHPLESASVRPQTPARRRQATPLPALDTLLPVLPRPNDTFSTGAFCIAPLEGVQRQAQRAHRAAVMTPGLNYSRMPSALSPLLATKRPVVDCLAGMVVRWEGGGSRGPPGQAGRPLRGSPRRFAATQGRSRLRGRPAAAGGGGPPAGSACRPAPFTGRARAARPGRGSAPHILQGSLQCCAAGAGLAPCRVDRGSRRRLGLRASVGAWRGGWGQRGG